MAAVFPFRSFGIACNRLGLDLGWPGLAGYDGFLGGFGDFRVPALSLKL
jgi:hypothetical protein